MSNCFLKIEEDSQLNSFKLNKKTLIALLFLINTICIYVFLFKNMVIPLGWDTQFHLNRIEELAFSLHEGHVLPSNGTYAFKQIGLAVNKFYPYIYLYPFAGLRNIVNPVLAYNVILSSFTLCSFFLSFFCIFKITKSRKAAVIFSLLFNNSGYLLLQITRRGDLAEYIALIFLPVFVYGL